MKRLILATSISMGIIWGQVATSSLVGKVTDPNGLGVPGVVIKAVRVDTGQTRTVIPRERGDFVFSNMEPGTYNVTFSLAGFKTKELKNLVLITGETLPLGTVQLELGTVGERVEVVGQSESVMTRSAERAAEITSNEMTDLEVRGRNFMDLLELIPGAVSTAKSQDISSNPSVYVAGSRTRRTT